MMDSMGYPFDERYYGRERTGSAGLSLAEDTEGTKMARRSTGLSLVLDFLEEYSSSQGSGRELKPRVSGTNNSLPLNRQTTA